MSLVLPQKSNGNKWCQVTLTAWSLDLFYIRLIFSLIETIKVPKLSVVGVDMRGAEELRFQRVVSARENKGDANEWMWRRNQIMVEVPALHSLLCCHDEICLKHVVTVTQLWLLTETLWEVWQLSQGYKQGIYQYQYILVLMMYQYQAQASVR